MKGILYYFSGTGNTKWVADRFKEKFQFYNIDIDLAYIQSVEERKIEKYDFIIIGFPVHWKLPPKIVTNFLNRLNNTKENTRAIVYSTQGASSSSASCFVAGCLKKKGYVPDIQVSIKMPNNFYFFIGKKYNESEIENLLVSVDKKITNIVESFIKGRIVKESNSLIRLQFSKVLHSVFKGRVPKLSRNISSTKDCVKCGLCLRNCPQGNITFENGHAVFHSKCILCLRCIHICPINAIRYRGKKIEQTQKNIIQVLDLNK
ncbi:EFR1 family ferrodoxin [Clostridium sp. AWRP]|uniref:EFR1 family ferrodoxin n=1 Tax=Clostridium sp. AWRP TaxID=2212991 RepID=UPI000FD9E577|nr:EFR1 family ferrodoxin [Clostridium sp. AWRP]AZV55186.1 (Fe-S)-binding protein [Clostridium sp. AWRP]